MAIYSFVILILLVFIALTKSESVDADFRQKVKNLLSDETFQRNFGGKSMSIDEFTEAVHKATAKFDEVIGETIADSLSAELAENGRRVADFITPTQIFDIYASAISNSLKDNGILSAENVDKMAKKYANFLEKSAMATKGDSITETFPALTSANAKFFKSLGLTSQKFVNQFAKNLLKELANY